LEVVGGDGGDDNAEVVPRMELLLDGQHAPVDPVAAGSGDDTSVAVGVGTGTGAHRTWGITREDLLHKLLLIVVEWRAIDDFNLRDR